MNKYLLLFPTVFLSFLCQAQKCYPCLKLKIGTASKKIKIDTLERATISYTLTNCSDSTFVISDNDIPEYNENAGIYFKVFRCGESCKPYEYGVHDIQLIDPGNNYYLKPNESFTYNIKLFKFYTIFEPGQYRFVGFFKDHLGNPKSGYKGFYLQESNQLDIVIVK